MKDKQHCKNAMVSLILKAFTLHESYSSPSNATLHISKIIPPKCLQCLSLIFVAGEG